MNQASHEAVSARLGLPLASTHLPADRVLPEELVRSCVEKFKRHGRFSQWWALLDQIPSTAPTRIELDSDAPRAVGSTLPESFWRELGPWKKGPFQIGETFLDAEWRSCLKWDRVREIASPLDDRKVLDVGTGNGYFLLRSAGAGARFTLGLEPSAHYCAQFLALASVFRCDRIALLPATSSEFTYGCRAFDTVLSMGVLYHRRSPLDHLAELRSFLSPGGELVLETLVVPGTEGYSLVPRDRYAMMRNVWFIPSVPTMTAWLRRLGFVDIRVSEPVTTTPQEQRTTRFTNQPSLADFLDPHDPTRTIEGYPAPARAIWVAKAP